MSEWVFFDYDYTKRSASESERLREWRLERENYKLGIAETEADDE